MGTYSNQSSKLNKATASWTPSRPLSTSHMGCFTCSPSQMAHECIQTSHMPHLSPSPMASPLNVTLWSDIKLGINIRWKTGKFIICGREQHTVEQMGQRRNQNRSQKIP